MDFITNNNQDKALAVKSFHVVDRSWRQMTSMHFINNYASYYQPTHVRVFKCLEQKVLRRMVTFGHQGRL